MRDRIYFNSKYRDFLKELDINNTLGFHLVNQKDLFLIAVALGLNEPKEISGKKEGLFLLKDVKTSDRAIFASITLGNLQDDKDIDKYANDDINYDEAEKCAEAGYAILKEKIDDSAGNEDLLVTRLLSELDLLYESNVKSCE